ncbi:MAG: hypothetical protein ACXWWD_03545 [Chitinophagaceae bacterium]
MSKQLRYITSKINAIQFALLRYHDKKGTLTMHVTVETKGDNSLICLLKADDDLKKLRNKKVNLVQKSEDDYLYISGQVTDTITKDKKEVLVHILKACWFVRKSKGSLSWLQEKHIYDIMPLDDLELAS